VKGPRRKRRRGPRHPEESNPEAPLALWWAQPSLHVKLS